MVVVQTLGVGTGAGAVAELHIGAFLGGVDHVGLMAEAVGEDDVAAGIDQIHGGLIALLTLGNIGLDDVALILDQTQVSAGFLGGVDEVEVVGGVLVMQGDEAHLDLGRGDTVGRATVSAATAAGRVSPPPDNVCRAGAAVGFTVLVARCGLGCGSLGLCCAGRCAVSFGGVGFLVRRLGFVLARSGFLVFFRVLACIRCRGLAMLLLCDGGGLVLVCRLLLLAAGTQT